MSSAATVPHSTTGAVVEFGPPAVTFSTWADGTADAITYAAVGADKTSNPPFESSSDIEFSGLADLKDRHMSGTSSAAASTNTCSYTKARLAALLATKGIIKSWRWKGPDLTGQKCQGYLVYAKEVVGGRNAERMIEYQVMPDNGVYSFDINS